MGAGVTRVMSLQEEFVIANRLSTEDLSGLETDDLVDQQHGLTMRNGRLDVKCRGSYVRNFRSHVNCLDGFQLKPVEWLSLWLSNGRDGSLRVSKIGENGFGVS